MKKLLLLIILFISIAGKAQKPALPPKPIQPLPNFNATLFDPSAVSGYFFFASNDHLIIMDNEGNVIYCRTVQGAFDFTVTEDNRMMFTQRNKTYLMNSDFKPVDSLECKNGYYIDAHDRLVLPDGHFLLLCDEKIKVDFTKYPEWKNKWVRDTIGVAAGIIQELDAQHNVVFEWHAKDHFEISDADIFFDSNTGTAQWTHCNAFALDEDGNILLSSRDFNEITKINRKDGSIMWRLGGKKNEFTFVNCPVPFYGQHNIRKLPNGHFTLFDDGQHTVSHGARAIEFELDEVKKVFTLVWSYTFDDDMSCNGRGSVQRLADGNTVICYGNPTWSDICFVVVNQKGNKLLQVNGPLGTYRVANVPSLPFKLNQPKINCFDSAGTKYLDAGAGHNSYLWSNGDTTRVIPVKQTDAYSVFVPYEKGGFVCSEKFVVKNISKPCNSAGNIRKKKKGDKN